MAPAIAADPYLKYNFTAWKHVSRRDHMCSAPLFRLTSVRVPVSLPFSVLPITRKFTCVIHGVYSHKRSLLFFIRFLY